MKTLSIFAFAFTFLNVQYNFLPKASLLIVMGLLIALDFGTGVLKAVLLKKARTSEGYRKTVVKFMQYGGAVVVGILLKYLSLQQPNMVDMATYIDYLTNGLVAFIIFIEATSVLENIYAVDSESPFSRFLVGPLLKLMTFQIKNNPISKLADQQKTTS
jgi:phage-related holin